MADMENPAEGPLWKNIMESQPGMSTIAGYNTFRGANTIMRGGYMDFKKGNKLTNFSRQKYRYMQAGSGELTAVSEAQYMGGKRLFKNGARGPMARRAEKLANVAREAEEGTKIKAGYFRSARLNNATMRPRAFGRFHSASVFGEDIYSPFRAGHFMSGKMGKKMFGKGLEEKGITAKEGKNLFGSGLLSSISAGRRMDLLEKKGKSLAKSERTIKAIAKMNGVEFQEGANLGNMMASSLAGEGTKYYAGYMRGALGKAELGGLTGSAEIGAKAAVEHLGTALGKAGLETTTENVLSRGVFKELGAKGVGKLAMEEGGAKFLAARGLAMAIPGLQFAAMASMAYDIGKIGGQILKSGINLSKDAVKSMKGNIAKQPFGSVYRDTQAAATSRSRGVMAIQNSQLNARSVLGSEAGLLAAHFG